MVGAGGMEVSWNVGNSFLIAAQMRGSRVL